MLAFRRGLRLYLVERRLAMPLEWIGISSAPSLWPAVKKSSLGDEGYACQSKNALLRHISAITAYI